VLKRTERPYVLPACDGASDGRWSSGRQTRREEVVYLSRRGCKGGGEGEVEVETWWNIGCEERSFACWWATGI